MYLLFELLRPVFFILRLIIEIKDKLYYLGMPKEVPSWWEWELMTPEEKFPELKKQKRKFGFRKGSIAYIIFNLLYEESGEWVTLKKMKDATGKDFPLIRTLINQIEKKIEPYKIEPSGKGSYRLINS